MNFLCSMLAALVGQPLVGAAPTETFELAGAAGAAPFIVETDTDPAVVRAADDVRNDVQRVSGRLPEHWVDLVTPCRHVVIIGVVGKSPLLDRLAATGKIELKGIANAWETFAMQIVANPIPGVSSALVIAGSDRRGAIYGLYEISSQIGVSPWHWWADVPVARQFPLIITPGPKVVGPPSVKYRGIFLNDEDWGLQPWAAHTFEKETGDIGPKTYAKVFELLLRLRGNLVWPAMHPSTKAFNRFPENKRVADAYGIVMGSSHAEPMLRNNVGEWSAPPHDYNYVANRDGVLQYWERRVAENGQFENIYTLGMRGIHDSHMIGPRTDPERIQVLEQVFADQRSLIARYVKPDVASVPQMFCAYKEVLALYRLGLKVPDDVTIVWPDDNFGYVRHFANGAERQRAGGSGVYYHLSYLGSPLSYLWLSTTPPALIWQQMHQSYTHGADRLWIANVGDIKPAEISMEFFLQMAWDANRWNPDNLPDFLRGWARREFGPENASRIADLMERYYLLNFQRRPEHLQWWLPGAAKRGSDLTDEEVRRRLESFSLLRQESEAVQRALPAAFHDAYFQLVHYPIVGSALANERYFRGERGQMAQASEADAALKALTRQFNQEISGGKWRGIMTLEPADSQWATMRIAPWAALPAPVTRPAPPTGQQVVIDAADFQHSAHSGQSKWQVVPGLGRTGRAVTVLPSDGPTFDLASLGTAPRLEYSVNLPAAGDGTLEIQLLPTHPLAGDALRIAVAVDGKPARMLALAAADGPVWSQGVLNGTRRLSMPIHFDAPGRHAIHLHGVEPGVVVDRLVVDFAASSSTYLGPNSNQREGAQ